LHCRHNTTTSKIKGKWFGNRGRRNYHKMEATIMVVAQMEIGEVETKIKGEVARRNLRRVTFTVTIAKDMNTLLMNPCQQERIT